MIKLILIVCFSTIIFAHELVIKTIDNNDNTITIVGSFDNGEETAGALVKLESLISGSILFSQRLPESSKLIVAIPKEPYQIVLDGGPEHVLVQEGIAPIEGYEPKLIKKRLSVSKDFDDEFSTTTIVFFVLCSLLFLLTIYISNKNTNKILKELKEQNKSEI